MSINYIEELLVLNTEDRAKARKIINELELKGYQFYGIYDDLQEFIFDTGHPIPTYLKDILPNNLIANSGLTRDFTFKKLTKHYLVFENQKQQKKVYELYVVTRITENTEQPECPEFLRTFISLDKAQQYLNETYRVKTLVGFEVKERSQTHLRIRYKNSNEIYEAYKITKIPVDG